MRSSDFSDSLNNFDLPEIREYLVMWQADITKGNITNPAFKKQIFVLGKLIEMSADFDEIQKKYRECVATFNKLLSQNIQQQDFGETTQNKSKGKQKEKNYLATEQRTKKSDEIKIPPKFNLQHIRPIVKQPFADQFFAEELFYFQEVEFYKTEISKIREELLEGSWWQETINYIESVELSIVKKQTELDKQARMHALIVQKADTLHAGVKELEQEVQTLQNEISNVKDIITFHRFKKHFEAFMQLYHKRLDDFSLEVKAVEINHARLQESNRCVDILPFFSKLHDEVVNVAKDLDLVMKNTFSSPDDKVFFEMQCNALKNKITDLEKKVINDTYQLNYSVRYQAYVKCFIELTRLKNLPHYVKKQKKRLHKQIQLYMNVYMLLSECAMETQDKEKPKSNKLINNISELKKYILQEITYLQQNVLPHVSLQSLAEIDKIIQISNGQLAELQLHVAKLQKYFTKWNDNFRFYKSLKESVALRSPAEQKELREVSNQLEGIRKKLNDSTYGQSSFPEIEASLIKCNKQLLFGQQHVNKKEKSSASLKNTKR